MCDCKRHQDATLLCTCICPEHRNFDKAYDLAMQRYDTIVEQATRIRDLERDKRQADWSAEGRVENLLADHLYDGSNGPLTDSQELDYRRNLAKTLVEEFGPPAPVIPVRDTQWYAYWTGVHQSVQHWADGTQMKCPYPQPSIDSEYHCAKDPGCNIKYGGEAPNQEHSANCTQLNRVVWK